MECKLFFNGPKAIIFCYPLMIMFVIGRRWRGLTQDTGAQRGFVVILAIIQHPGGEANGERGYSELSRAPLLTGCNALREPSRRAGISRSDRSRPVVSWIRRTRRSGATRSPKDMPTRTALAWHPAARMIQPPGGRAGRVRVCRWARVGVFPALRTPFSSKKVTAMKLNVGG